MKKLRLRTIIASLFAGFLLLSFGEVMLMPTGVEASEPAAGSTLEVPITGAANEPKTAGTYESLAEIALLALVGTAFYVLNSEKTINKLQK